MYGLDCLGAVTPSQHSKDRAIASGKRAIAAGQKIARTAPSLAAKIVQAGQKAVSAGSPKKQVSKPTPAPTQTAPQPATRPRAPSGTPQRQVQAPARKPPAVSRAMPAKRSRIGDDAAETGEEFVDEQATDAYSQLADAACKVADFMARVQDLVTQLPPGLPLTQNGLGTISQLENWFVAPLEKALQGDQSAMAQAQPVNDVVQFILDQEGNANLPWPWGWISNAQAYLRVHPAVVQPAAQPATAPGTIPAAAATPAAGSPVARIVITPKSIALGTNAPQMFSAAVLNAAGQPVAPMAPVAWSASIGATIDQSGAFTAPTPGNYTVTATADGVSATALAVVQASMSPLNPSAGGGSYGGGGGYSGGGGGSYDGGGYGGAPDDGGGYADDGGQTPQEEYADDGGGSDEGEAPMDEVGAALAVLGRGGGGGRGHGGGRHGGGHHHHGGRGRGGGGWWGGPWAYGPSYYVDEPFDAAEPTVDDIAEAVAQKLAKQTGGRVAVGLDFLGAAAPDVADFNKRTWAQRKEQIKELQKRPRADMRALASQQIAKVQAHFSQVGWVTRHLPILSAKWDAVTQLLELAQAQLGYADAEPDEAKANTRYALALINSTDAAAALAEADGTSIADDLVDLMVLGMREEGRIAARLAKGAGEGASEVLGVPPWLLWTVGGLAVAAVGASAVAPLLIVRR